MSIIPFLYTLLQVRGGGGGVAVLSVKSCWLMLMPSVLQPLHSWKKKYHVLQVRGGGGGGSFISKVLLANADALCAAASPLMEEEIPCATSKRGGGVAVLSVKSCWLMLMPSVLQPLHSWKKKYHCEYNTFLIYLTTSKRGGGQFYQ